MGDFFLFIFGSCWYVFKIFLEEGSIIVGIFYIGSDGEMGFEFIFCNFL